MADQIEAAAGGDVEEAAEIGDATIGTVRSVRATYLATPYRPTGPTGPPAAIAALVEDLAWLRPFAARTPLLDPEQRQLRRAAAEVGAAVVQVLRASASAVEGGDERPDLGSLDRARETVADDFDQRIRELGGTHDEAAVAATLEEAYRMRSLSDAALQLAVHALGAAGEPAASLRLLEEDRPERVETMPSTRIGRAGEVARSYVSGRSVWFRNSPRAAIALALAVLVAQLLNLEHSFWVVLGTLSVLRSNALGTGSTVLEAIAGTFVGIVIGGLLVYLIGDNRALLWVALPIAILLGAAWRAISFAAGQGGFTIVVVILFNLIEPGGWEVGLVRIQDVAIGCGISLAVGLMFWPRGAASVVRRALATAYAGAAEYLAAVVEMLLRGGDPLTVERIDLAAVAASRRLDDAFRQFLSERPHERHSYHDLATLLAGVTRIRRTGHSLRASSVLARLGPLDPAESGDAAGPGRELESEVDGLTHWYGKLSQSITSRGAPPAPEPDNDLSAGRLRVLIHEAAGASEEAELLRGLGIAWTSRHLETLRHLEPHLVAAARELADSRESPAAEEA